MQDSDQEAEPTVGARTPHAAATASLPSVHEHGAVNWIGVETLVRREILRFLKVYGQTLLAPIATAGMFLAVFAVAVSSRRPDLAGDAFIAFLAPGVVMMTVLQNAFANTSSSIMIAKLQGNIADTLTPPLTPAEIVFGVTAGGVARGALVALCAAAVLFPVAGVGLAQPVWAAFFVLVGSTILSLLGLAAAIWAVKFDHMAAITNFIVTPLSFLSGSFYSIQSLPPAWEALSRYNPIFYLIDGFRYGAVGAGDADPWVGAAVSLAVVAALWALCQRMIASGYRLKS